ncbi:MAG TPA: DEAD/DEAH box helicase [Acidimicrobiales bacterium]|nr:DEAD/DEAH box helicase [Acidimicrobiales bacterium]
MPDADDRHHADDRPDADDRQPVDDRQPDRQPIGDGDPAADAAAADEEVGADGGQAAAGFAALGLDPALLDALAALGYEEPTPIQEQAIPVLLTGRDVLGQAATGTGKTAAFALPVLHRLGARSGRSDDPGALVLVPTRELAMQVSEALHRYGRGLGVRVVPLYGGQPIGRQLRALDGGVDVVVATPGRALDHLHRGTLRLGGLQVVVLDEADEMLDMGFADDLEALLGATPPGRQTVLFSATMPRRLDAIAAAHQRDPVQVRTGSVAPAAGAAPLVRHLAYVVARASKAAALGRILDVEAATATLVFCRTRDQVDALTETLNGRGYRAEALHGGMGQEQRDRVMGRLRSGTAELLVATDVAARGLDVDVLSHVVNYDVPSSVEAYVHRMGRVGRAGRTGTAITLAEPREHRMLKTIERVTGQRISVERVPTVADLQARRLELTRAAVREHLGDDDLDRFRVVLESLVDEVDVVEVALAALKLAHERVAGGDEAGDDDIVDLAHTARAERAGTPRSAGRPGRERWEDDQRGRGGDADRGPRRERPAGRERGGPPPGSARVFVGAGREAGVRPQDLVGAITGETRLSGRDVGAIDIAPRFALVDVPEAAVDEVVAALRDTGIRGRRVTVRRDRDA